MSRFIVLLGIVACIASLTGERAVWAITFNKTFSGTTYTIVEADPFVSGGSPGNTVNKNAPAAPFANSGSQTGGLWNNRDFGGMDFDGQPASNPDLFELSSGASAATPTLRTTVSGLPAGSYDTFLVFMVEADRPGNPIPAATLAAESDVGQALPTTLRGGRTQPGLILTGNVYGGGGYEVALAPLGTISGTSFAALVSPLWAGDLNNDRFLGQDDLNVVLANYGQIVNPGDRSVGNTNDDQLINDTDISNITRYWGSKGYPAGFRGDYIGLAYTAHVGGTGTGSGVPEPVSIVLVLSAVFGVTTICRRRLQKVIVMLVAVCVLAGSMQTARADINGSFAQVTTEGGDIPPAGFVSQDLTVNATTDWLASNMLVVLTSGTINQDTSGGNPSPLYAGPNPVNFPFVPSSRWDTYVTGSGGLTEAAPKSAGGAVDLGGSATSAFTTTGINLEWYTTSNSDIGSFTLGRFTLQNTAQGTWKLRLDSLGQAAPLLLSGNVQNGLLIAGVAGDYNANGKVDAADYVSWRKNPAGFGGDPAGYNTWRSSFGNTPGSGSGLVGGANVPEPGTLVLFATCIAVVSVCRGHSRLLSSRSKSSY